MGDVIFSVTLISTTPLSSQINPPAMSSNILVSLLIWIRPAEIIWRVQVHNAEDEGQRLVVEPKGILHLKQGRL